VEDTGRDGRGRWGINASEGAVGREGNEYPVILLTLLGRDWEKGV